MTKPVVGLTTWGGATQGSTADLDQNFEDVTDAQNDLNTYSNYLVDTGAANAYVVSLAANLTATLAAGLQIQIKITNTNTGASTLNFNGTGIATIQTSQSAAVSAGMLVANGVYDFIYTGTVWQVQNPSAPSGMVLLATRTANGNTTVNFNSTLSGTYDKFLLVGSDVTVETSAAGVAARVSENGTVYNSTANSYSYSVLGAAAGAAPDVFQAQANGNQIILAPVVSNTAVVGVVDFETWFSKTASTTNGKNFTTHATFAKSGVGFATYQGGGQYVGNAAILGIQVYATVGNISGNFALYGLVRT